MYILALADCGQTSALVAQTSFSSALYLRDTMDSQERLALI